MSDAVYFRLLTQEDKEKALSTMVEATRESKATRGVHIATTTSFGQIPGSPFAYWVTENVRAAFRLLPRFDSGGRRAQIGASTKNDFRYLRAWWETRLESAGRNREDTSNGKRWIPLAKGGTYSPFYRDCELVIDWMNDGETLKREIAEYRGSRGWGYHWTAALNGHDAYFRPGLTWPRATVKGFNARAMPLGCIFADKGPAAVVQDDCAKDLLKLLGLVNSAPFESLLLLQTASRAWEVGLVQQTPVPDLESKESVELAQKALENFEHKRAVDQVNETSHVFLLPSLLCTPGMGLRDHFAAWQSFTELVQIEMACNQAELENLAFRMYGFMGRDRDWFDVNSAIDVEGSGDAKEELGSDDELEMDDLRETVEGSISYGLGCVLGRWDFRNALDPTLAPKLQGPFEPLPLCSPAMLVGPDGLPAGPGGIASEEWLRQRLDAITFPPEQSVAVPRINDADYPLRIDWDGILVDDPEHAADVVRRVREVLHLLWGERADAIEAEAVGILGVKDLRDWFRNPRHFWDSHVKRYSKSRRKAPIYWLLQSPKRHYAIWLYYHRLDPDILFKALVNYVEPKLRLEEDRLSGLNGRRATTAAGGETRRLEKAIDQQEAVLSDLHEFRDRLDRAARLHLRPDLDDGVLLNIAPLRELVPWKEAKRAWDELMAGTYEWSSVGKQLREKGLV